MKKNGKKSVKRTKSPSIPSARELIATRTAIKAGAVDEERKKLTS
jgi:hypothetical protein